MEILRSARNSLARANEMIAAGNYDFANEELNNGIKTLGYAYLSTKFIDDTNQRLLAANDAEHKGNIQAAVNIKYRTLESRLSLCQQNIR
jgi:hypothetical protein